MRLAVVTCLTLLAAASAAAPQLRLIAYVGGSGTDDCDAIALDRAGDIYLACHSDSPDFPRSQSSDAQQSRGMDAFVVKIDARTGRLVWATRTGGGSWDAAGDLALKRRRIGGIIA